MGLLALTKNGYIIDYSKRKALGKCNFCGSIFKFGLRTFEPRCPKCREYDIERIGDCQRDMKISEIKKRLKEGI